MDLHLLIEQLNGLIKTLQSDNAVLRQEVEFVKEKANDFMREVEEERDMKVEEYQYLLDENVIY